MVNKECRQNISDISLIFWKNEPPPPLVLLLNLQFYQYIANISEINNDNICIPNSDMNNFVSFLKVKQKTKTKQKKILYI